MRSCRSAADASAPLHDRARVRVHLGTAEVMARVRLDTPLEPGIERGGRLNLEAPLVARGDDRLVLRSYSPMSVIGGGAVIDPLPGAGGARPPALASLDPATRLDALVERRRHGVERRLLPMLLGLPPAACAALLRRSTDLTAAQANCRPPRTDRPPRHQPGASRWQVFHRQEPYAAGFSIETLRHSPRCRRPDRRERRCRPPSVSRSDHRPVGTGGTARVPACRPRVRSRSGPTCGRGPGRGADGARRGRTRRPPGHSRRRSSALRQAAGLGEVAWWNRVATVATEALEGFAGPAPGDGCRRGDHPRLRSGTGPACRGNT